MPNIHSLFLFLLTEGYLFVWWQHAQFKILSYALCNYEKTHDLPAFVLSHVTNNWCIILHCISTANRLGEYTIFTYKCHHRNFIVHLMCKSEKATCSRNSLHFCKMALQIEPLSNHPWSKLKELYKTKRDKLYYNAILNICPLQSILYLIQYMYSKSSLTDISHW